MTQSINSQILKTLFLAILCVHNIFGQSVGVVLSGGGSSGLAHIGVLKALEDNNIPIDYITGTSMGAVIGGLYSAGYNLDEIEQLFTSQRFKNALKGRFEEDYVYYYQQGMEDASWINIKANKDTLLNKILPTNVLTPVQLDIELLELLSGASALSNYSFDSLFIPFRCIASDIQNKHQIIFDSGELHKAIRASSTYPFFFRPIYVDGQLLFDGGLYNNFPSDILYQAFSPDVIIGSNVTSGSSIPNPDDLFSQLENMISTPPNLQLPCENGLVISPKTNTFTLDFSDPAKNIQLGYEETLLYIDSLNEMIHRVVTKEEVAEKRKEFLGAIPPYLIKDVHLNGEKTSFLKYYEKLMQKKKSEESISFSQMKKKYIRLFKDDKISYAFPTMKYNKKQGVFNMDIRIHKEKDLSFKFGGNFSSRPVNMGFLGVKYNFFGKVPKHIEAKSYFGKFYSSILLTLRMDFHERIPFFIEPFGTLQQWDYFKSFATFFEESKPPFLLQKDEFLGVRIGMPIKNRGVFIGDWKAGKMENNYYQVDNFSPSDTSDMTEIDYFTQGLHWTRSSLNKKQFANQGTFLKVSARAVDAIENTIPGSTGTFPEEIKVNRKWLSFKINYENYFKTIDRVTLGFSVTASYTTTPILSNYKSTILLAPRYQPIPESKTLFQEEFRAHKYAAFGARVIYSPINNIDVRLESYIFQPVHRIIENEFRQAEYGKAFNRRYYIISTSAIYHSPLGPLSFSVNYYDKREENFSWILNFGYLIFNERPLD